MFYLHTEPMPLQSYMHSDISNHFIEEEVTEEVTKLCEIIIMHFLPNSEILYFTIKHFQFTA